MTNAKRLYGSLLLFFCWGMLIPLWGQVSFEARVSKKKLGLNERLRIDFVMNENGDNFSPPPFTEFRVVGGPQQSTQNSYINGKRSFSKAFTYFLTPKSKGRLTIGAAQVTIGGERYQTAPVTIEVTDAVERPRGDNDVEYLADENLLLIAEVSNSSPFLNEGFSVVYKLLFRAPIKVSDAREIESPAFADFWSHTIKIPQFKIEKGTYKGEEYNMVVWRKNVLYPQKSGRLSLEPLALNVVVQIPTNRRDFFGNILYQQVNRTVTAGKRALNVRALPEAGQPEDFSGAVGTFDFDVLLNKDLLKASESFQATLKVRGNGNLKLFELPKITTPNSLEVYEPEYSEDVKVTLRGMEGTVENRYTIIPQYQGKFPIPAVSFSYFDPQTETYKTVRSQELLVNVFEGPSGYTNTSALPATNRIALPEENSFKFIKLKGALTLINSPLFFRSQLFYVLLAAPFVLLGLLLLLLRVFKLRAQDTVGSNQRKAQRLVRKYLSEAKQNQKDKAAFYEALERALHNYLKAKVKLETTDYSKDKIQTLLQTKGVPEAQATAFIQLLENCDLARFTPVTQLEIQKDFSQAGSLLNSIEKQLRP